ncbi:MAG: hypothetical protein D3910_15030, partial [Candidatus Electrothrix sp. ATG2]|nr:hypothetical protein [Candidatus Electrothrix sp. ATG2]
MVKGSGRAIALPVPFFYSGRASKLRGEIMQTQPTQLELAWAGKMTEQIQTVARKEGIDPELVKNRVATGEIVIANHPIKRINCNVFIVKKSPYTHLLTGIG